ncbi:MAG: class I tRNA ligase family protein, partial [Candidatus Peregrinibacteria bacterium]|nr:class I tRNA ligase family protein [Candidatus Peregrinibacteria bacterium]
MFDPVDPKQRLPEMEEGILQYWREEDIFKRSVRRRAAGNSDAWDGKNTGSGEVYSFYDGPPFATGLPHYGHLLAGTIKDVIPRFQSMRGKMVQRRFGWDCHGLPVENLIEKEHNITDKNQIEEMGVGAFNNLCRSSVQRYTAEWRKTVERMGRWVDMDWDYKTMEPTYMESIWWVFAELYRKKLIYEGRKSMHVCPRCVTPLSNFEVTQGYSDVTDWTSYTTYPLEEDPNTSLIAWTTTTWTLPGNLFLAVGPTITYAKVQLTNHESQMTYIVAESLVDQVFKDKEYSITGTLKANDLVGKHYT